MSHERFERWWKGSVRWCGAISLAAFVLIWVAAAMNSDLYAIAILVSVLSLVIVATQPLGFTAGAALRNLGAVPDRIRVAAALLAIPTLWLAWRTGEPDVASGRLYASVLLPAGLLALAAPFFPPRVPRLGLPRASVIAPLLVLLLARLPEMFAGTKERAYHNALREKMEHVRTLEAAIREDSGRYSATLDSIFLAGAATVNTRVELTRNGYRAWATSRLMSEDHRCAVYEGATLAEPATRPGVVACTPLIDPTMSSLAFCWTFGIVVTGVIGFVLARPASEFIEPFPGRERLRDR